MNIISKIGIKFIIALIIGGLLGYAFGVSRMQTKEVSETAKKPIKIGAIFSLTGNGAAYGEPARDGLKLAVEKINKDNGIKGRQVEVIYEDSRFDPKTAVSAYQSLAGRGINYFFSNGSSVSVALKTPVAIDNNFLFEVGAVTPLYRDGKPNTCRATLTADVSGKALGDFIAKTLKAKTVGFLTLSDEFGTSVRDNVSQTVKGYDIEVVAEEGFAKDASDFRTQITKIKDKNPDALVVIPSAGQAEIVFRQLRDLEWKGALVSDNWTIVNQNLKDLSLVEGVYFSNYDWSAGAKNGEPIAASEFKKAFYEKFQYDPPVIAATAYDSAQILAKSLGAVGSADALMAGEWLTKNINGYNGVTGSITLNDDCEGSRAVVIQEVKQGEFVLIE